MQTGLPADLNRAPKSMGGGEGFHGPSIPVEFIIYITSFTFKGIYIYCLFLLSQLIAVEYTLRSTCGVNMHGRRASWQMHFSESPAMARCKGPRKKWMMEGRSGDR